MSEAQGSYFSVIFFAIILGALSVLLWRSESVNTIEQILIIASVFFCLFLLFKQHWALVGICCTLLAAILVYFTQAWLFPLVNEDTAMIMPNVRNMIVGIIAFIFIGRERISNLFS